MDKNLENLINQELKRQDQESKERRDARYAQTQTTERMAQGFLALALEAKKARVMKSLGA